MSEDDKDMDKLINTIEFEGKLQHDAIDLLVEVLRDYREDGLESSVLWSLFFQFLKLEAEDVKQAIVDAQWEWAK